MTHKIIILLSFCLLFTSFQPSGKYTKKFEQDNIEIYYKWKKKFPYTQDADRTLVLYLANRNDQRVAVTFSLDFYNSAIIHSTSEELQYCMPANYEMAGNFRNLEFSTGGLTWQQITSDSIRWEINEFKLEKNKECETEGNWLE